MNDDDSTGRFAALVRDAGPAFRVAVGRLQVESPARYLQFCRLLDRGLAETGVTIKIAPNPMLEFFVEGDGGRRVILTHVIPPPAPDNGIEGERHGS